MSNQDQTPAAEQPAKHAQGPEIQPVVPEHEVKPETAQDESSPPKDVKPA